MLIAWREDRLTKVKGATVRRQLIVLAGFFSCCFDVKLWLSTSPLDDVKFPSDSNHRERVISDEEIGIMMGGLDGEVSNIFLFALETGMRQSEICEMTWDRVYITKRFVRLLVKIETSTDILVHFTSCHRSLNFEYKSPTGNCP